MSSMGHGLHSPSHHAVCMWAEWAHSAQQRKSCPTPSCPVTQNGGCTGLGVLPSKLNRSWHKLPKGSLVLTNLSAEKMEVLGQTTSLGSVQMR